MLYYVMIDEEDILMIWSGGDSSLRSRWSLSYSKFPNILWNLEVQSGVYKIPPLVPTLSQLSPVHTTPFYFYNIHHNITPYVREMKQ